jgi:hypothetical protein
LKLLKRAEIKYKIIERWKSNTKADGKELLL